jgi:hypothetical protein
MPTAAGALPGAMPTAVGMAPGGFIAGVVLALLLLVARVINGQGGDLVSVVLGRHAWGLVGKPNRRSNFLTRF